MIEQEPRIVIQNVAQELKKMIKQPEWAPYVKTGAHKEKPPADKDWFFTRAAAVLRTVALKGPIGVAKLRTKYGGRKNRGMRPEKFYKGSGNILRKVLQEMNKAGLTKQTQIGLHKGHIITPKGQSLLAKAGHK